MDGYNKKKKKEEEEVEKKEHRAHQQRSTKFRIKSGSNGTEAHR